MTIFDLIAIAIVLGIGWAMLSASIRSLPRDEGRLVVASFAMHAFASFATAIISEIVYRGVVDSAGFHRAGSMIADAIRLDPVGVIPRTIGLFFHQDYAINVPLNLEPNGGRPTVSMWIIAAYGELVLGSIRATATACALFSFSGKLLAYRTLRRYFDDWLRPYVAMSILLVPSVVYWTSGLIKESIAVGGLGYALYGAHALFADRRMSGAVPLLVGAVLVGVIKPYLLMPFGIGTGALLYMRAATVGGREPFRIRPLHLVVGAAIALAAVIAVGRAFPAFAVENIGESAARMQFYGRRAAGGSYYMLGDPTEVSALGQLKFAPVALFTALYRPTLLDVRNPVMLLNSIETTFLLGLTLYVLAISGWRWAVRRALFNPALAFGLAFAVPLALGVGLVSNNFGTLSRYRCPLVPYQVMVLAVLFEETRRRAPQRKPAVPSRGAIPRLPPLPPPSQRPARQSGPAPHRAAAGAPE